MGLTPEDISTAFRIELNRQQLEQQRDIATAQAEREQERIEIARTQAETSRLGQIRMILKDATEDERTAAMKNYEFARSPQGGNFKGTFAEFDRDARTGNQKDYESAVAGGYDGQFHEWLLDMKRAGATRISLGEKIAQREAFTDIDVAEQFRKPDYVDRVVKEEIGSGFEAFASDLSPNEKKVKMRQRVLSDLRRAFPGKEITGEATDKGVTFKIDDKTILVWTDPSVPEVNL